MVYKLLLCCFSTAFLLGQTPAVSEKTIKSGDYNIEINNVKEAERDLVHTDKSPESVADFSQMYLKDMDGSKFSVEKDKVTVIEYWSIKTARDNLYWSRAREMEKKYAAEKGFQLLSVNYDYVRSGKIQIDAVKNFLKDYTNPQQVFIDADDGLRDIFLMRGPISYLLINHKGVYTYTYRGDDPDAGEFFEHVDNAVEFMIADRQGHVPDIPQD